MFLSTLPQPWLQYQSCPLIRVHARGRWVCSYHIKGKMHYISTKLATFRVCVCVFFTYLGQRHFTRVQPIMKNISVWVFRVVYISRWCFFHISLLWWIESLRFLIGCAVSVCMTFAVLGLSQGKMLVPNEHHASSHAAINHLSQSSHGILYLIFLAVKSLFAPA